MRFVALSAALLCGVAACTDTPSSPTSSALTPSSATYSRGGVPVPGRYIVRFRSGAASAHANAMAVQQAHGGRVDREFNHALNGAVMELTASQLATLSNDSRVLAVEQDQVITLSSTQSNATWGLDRIDQHTAPLNSSYTYNVTGSGVTAYIIDTGINFAQADFTGRATTGFDAITAGGNAADCNGHGTHTAGTVGSNTYGVAKGVKLVAVRVLDCNGSGTSSGVIAGIDWVTQHVVRPAVANMSLGGTYSAALNTAVQNSIAAGVTYAVSAGNSTADACNVSPASATGVITVGATSSADGFASFSNYGSCVTLNAPGVNITSLWIGASGTTNTISGTSMASPHVAGTAALYLQANPSAAPAQVRSALVANATPNVITGVPASTPNLLLYEGFIGAVAPAVNTAPTASISSPSAGASFTQGSAVTFTGTGSDAEDGALSGASLVWTSSIDGQVGTGATFSKSNLSVGSHVITLTARDSKGATGMATRSITITAVATNQPPVAAFTFNCNTGYPHQCAVDGSTSRDDVGVTSYTWSWGDGRSETHVGATAKNTWAATGSYNVTLKVTDGSGLTNSITKAIAVP